MIAEALGIVALLEALVGGGLTWYYRSRWRDARETLENERTLRAGEAARTRELRDRVTRAEAALAARQTEEARNDRTEVAADPAGRAARLNRLHDPAVPGDPI